MVEPPATAGATAGPPSARPTPFGPDEVTVPAPRYLAGRYRLDRTLGRGAMGRVWAAHDESLGRWVAIKEVEFPRGLPPSEKQQVAERAMREARAIASVADPHVVTIFDLIASAEAPAIVMELLDARSLAQILSEDGPLDEAGTIVVGYGVSAGLLAAHAGGVTHRDVKPGNVLVCRDGRIKLTDFGIARSVGENSLTATGLLLGSPAYISPEVAGGATATHASDAWGLGALLFACVQGVPPYDQGNPLKTLVSVVNDPVPAHPRSGRLGGLINALLVKDPSRRMTTAAAYEQLRLLAGDQRGQRLITHPSQRRPAGPPPTPVQPIPAASTAGRVGRPEPSRPRPEPSPVRLPPPPWAGQSTSALPPLPQRARRRHPVGHWLLAVLLALLAAAAGFFGVRAVAELTSTNTHAAAVMLLDPRGLD